MDYSVHVESPAGCEYSDIVSIHRTSIGDLTVDYDIGICSFGTYGQFALETDIPNENILVKVTNLNQTIEYESFHPTGSGLTRAFEFYTYRNVQHQFRFEVSLVNYEEDCIDNSCKEILISPEVIPWSVYTAKWRAAPSFIFTPNGDGDNDVWKCGIRAYDPLATDCDDILPDLSSAQHVKITIYGRSGALVRTIIYDSDITDIDGITLIEWDGKDYEGDISEPWVYLLKVEVTSCYLGGDFLEDCENDYGYDDYTYASTGGTDVFHVSVHLML